MKFRTSLIAILFVPVISLMGMGCSSAPKKEPVDEVDEKERVSTLPWNTPQKWEKGTGMGAGTTY